MATDKETGAEDMISGGKKETSDEIATVAAKFLNISYSEFLTFIENAKDNELKDFWANVHSLAASALSQHETPGS